MSLFANAKTVETAKKSKKPAKAEVTIKDLEKLTAIREVIKSLSAFAETLESNVKSRMGVHYVDTGCEKRARPDNFKGVEGKAEASCEMRLKSSRSPVSAEDAELLGEYGISTETVTDVVETFVFNPAYKDNGEVLGLVDKYLKGKKGIPEDLIQFQPGTTRTVVSESALDEVFKLPKDVAAMLLPLVSTLAIKPKMNSEDITDSYAIVQELIGAEIM